MKTIENQTSIDTSATLGFEDLHRKFTTACKAVSKATGTLADVVQECIDAEIDRDTLVTWAMDCGWSLSHARNTIGAMLREEKGRVRSKGGGRKANPDGLELIALIDKTFPEWDQAKKSSALLAAWKIVKKTVK